MLNFHIVVFRDGDFERTLKKMTNDFRKKILPEIRKRTYYSSKGQKRHHKEMRDKKRKLRDKERELREAQADALATRLRERKKGGTRIGATVPVIPGYNTRKSAVKPAPLTLVDSRLLRDEGLREFFGIGRV